MMDRGTEQSYSSTNSSFSHTNTRLSDPLCLILFLIDIDMCEPASSREG